MRNKSLGLVLGSGSARGMAHIGVIRGLADLGIKPDVVCGSSVGALVAGALASGQLDQLQEYAANLKLRGLLRYFDPRRLHQGGFLDGDAIEAYFAETFGEHSIEDLSIGFGAVATDLLTGERIAFTKGDLWHVVRVSMSLPGFFPPVSKDNRWLVDGALVDPVPVTLCRDLGANMVIAVNLNSDITGKHLRYDTSKKRNRMQALRQSDFYRWLPKDFRSWTDSFFQEKEEKGTVLPPDIFDALASSINIMQYQVTRHQLEDDAPDILLAPKLSHIGLLDFERAGEAMDQGRDCVQRAARQLSELVK